MVDQLHPIWLVVAQFPHSFPASCNRSASPKRRPCQKTLLFPLCSIGTIDSCHAQFANVKWVVIVCVLAGMKMFFSDGEARSTNGSRPSRLAHVELKTATG